jgi:hypothetical protein
MFVFLSIDDQLKKKEEKKSQANRNDFFSFQVFFLSAKHLRGTWFFSSQTFSQRNFQRCVELRLQRSVLFDLIR